LAVKLVSAAPPSTTLRVVPLPRKRERLDVGTPSPRGILSRLRGRGTSEAGGGGSYTLRALLLLLTLLFSFPALAEEAITSFSTDITLRTDGSVEVTETIAVRSERNQISRGIFRDIPTLLVNPDNSRLRSDLNVIEVKRDGRAEPYTLENLDAGFRRIRIGDADVFLPDGAHTYTIRYTMTRMGRQFADHDELFWNATGNYWAFPILQSVTRVTLPDGANIRDLVGYTGRTGSTEQAVTITRVSENQAIFRTTRRLAAGEGVSVAASFQPGILAAPEGVDAWLNWLSDHRDLVAPIAALLLVLAYNLIAWNAVGRDPKKGTIIPLFHAPKGMSPALAHYIHKMGWQNGGWTAFTATIFDLGVRGLVTIDNPDKTLTVKSTGRKPEADLPPGEKLLADFFASRGTVKVDTTNGPKLNEKRGAFLKLVEGENRQAYFRNNSGYVALGVLLSVLALVGMVMFDMLNPLVLIFAVIGGVFIGVLAGFLKSFWQRPVIGKIILGVWVVLFGGNLIGSGINFTSDVQFDTPLLAAISIVVVNVVFAILMRAPTVQGRKLMDQIDGFRMYMDTSEKNRLNISGEPPMTVERFERILPYAIALGVEKPWSEHFEAELARNAVADAQGTYRPGFYSGRDWSSASGGFSKAVATATTAMSAAMIAAQPSSSSGSGFSSGGGGGSSGGGGGGGGGGGW
jgi:hypothetical protein